MGITYQVIGAHQACDSVGRGEVTSVQDCRRAAQFLGLRYSHAQHWPNLARNCWRNSVHRVYFNYNQRLAHGHNTWDICQRSIGESSFMGFELCRHGV